LLVKKNDRIILSFSSTLYKVAYSPLELLICTVVR